MSETANEETRFYMVMKDGVHVGNVSTFEQALEAAGVRLVELHFTAEARKSYLVVMRAEETGPVTTSEVPTEAAAASEVRSAYAAGYWSASWVQVNV